MRIQALRHSKVQLTWDQDDPNRTKVTRRNFTKEEIEEEDFKAFVASSDSEDADDSFRPAEAMPAASSGNPEKQSKKQALKQRTEQLRSLLLAGEQEEDDVWGKGGSTWQDELVPKKSSKATDRDMEITFRPGLSASQKLDGGDEEHLTTLEKYQMRMKERKARKKEKMEMKRVTTRDGLDESAQAVQGKDDFFGDDSGSDNGRQKLVTPPAKQPIPEDLGDVGGGGGGVEHFSIKDIIKAEKADSKKRKRKRPGKGLKNIENEREIELGPSDWKMDVRDRRFTALHEEPEFAIDPSNPQYV